MSRITAVNGESEEDTPGGAIQVTLEEATLDEVALEEASNLDSGVYKQRITAA